MFNPTVPITERALFNRRLPGFGWLSFRQWY